jgi:hypothetical protein
MSLIEKQPWALETSVFGTFLHVSVPDEKSVRAQIESLLGNNDIAWNKIERITPSLEDVFIYLLDIEAKKAA